MSPVNSFKDSSGGARAELLARVVDHVAASGLRDASLRELAAAVGTSHRMLHYHFGGRDGLVAAVVGEVEARQRAALEALAQHATGPSELIRAQWAQLTEPSVRPFVALFFEVLSLAAHGHPGTEGFLDAVTEPWLDLAERLAGELGTGHGRDDLRVGVAVVRGLLVDVVASGDPEPATAALERFLEMWHPTRRENGR